MSIWSWIKNLFTTEKPVFSGYSTRRALCVGINDYPDPANRLGGCRNDARNWSALLKELKGFTNPDILLDKMATRYNIVTILKDMCSQAKPGDCLVFTFSGHGTSIPSPDGFGRDEAICLYDDLLTDESLISILAMAPEGVRMTVVLDSCMSGDMIRDIKPEDAKRKRYMEPGNKAFAGKMRDMPINSRLLAPHDSIPMYEVLLAACDKTEFSYDSWMDNGDVGDDQDFGQCGAFSISAIKLIRENPVITYGQFGTMIDSRMPPAPPTPQHPQVECNPLSLSREIFT